MSDHDAQAYLLNGRTGVVHLLSCEHAARIQPDYRLAWPTHRSRDDRPCPYCMAVWLPAFTCGDIEFVAANDRTPT